MKISDVNLSLFFTRDVSLKTWINTGNIYREIAIYEKLAEYCKTVNFITYGGQEDYAYKNYLKNIQLYTVKKQKTTLQVMTNLFIKNKNVLQKSDIYKTNQIRGSEIPILAKKILGKKLIVRCGYLHSFFTKQQTTDRNQINKALRLERKAFINADIGIVTSSWQRDILINEYEIDLQKIKIIPNYILPAIFRPLPDIEKEYDLIFIGRGGNQKNLASLIQALDILKKKGQNISILMIGGCSSEIEIVKKINECDLRVHFLKNISNTDLPLYLNQAKIFILPSYYEGHPKSLLEAMSSGLPCIGTDVDGIKQDIKHMETGYLCRTDPIGIAEAIENLLSDEMLQMKLGKNARDYVIEHYSIDKILQMELNVIEGVMS